MNISEFEETIRMQKANRKDFSILKYRRKSILNSCSNSVRLKGLGYGTAISYKKIGHEFEITAAFKVSDMEKCLNKINKNSFRKIGLYI